VLHDRWFEKNSALHIISVYSSLNLHQHQVRILMRFYGP
jgi:hypothetical protein